jgi:hypothetical protein
MIRPEQMARLQYVRAANDASNTTTDLIDNFEKETNSELEESLLNSNVSDNSEIKESSDQDKPTKSKKDSWFKWS